MTAADLRGRVAAQLEELHRPKGPLHAEGDTATWRIHALDPALAPYDVRYALDRARVHRHVIEQYLSAQTGVATDGHAAVVTAGAPGAGKSTRLTALGYDSSWRRIDADDIKALLIAHDLAASGGTLPADLGTVILDDGIPVLPAELASLYHHESTRVADAVRDRAVTAHENVIIEGTLSWDQMGDQLITDLTINDYITLDVVLVDVPLDQALQQAADRWWDGRKKGAPGGRFTPEDTIRGMYPTPAESSCATNARQLVQDADDAGLHSTLKT